jgi:protein MpaA
MLALGAVAATVAAVVTPATSSSEAGRSSGEVFGHSVEGRPLEVSSTGGGSTRVLVVGSIHGDEPAGRKVIEQLSRDARVRGVELLLMRTLNPDGLRRGTRQNAHGVDLNRNFPRAWERQGSPGSQYYSGPRPLSEPESRAAARLVRRVEPDLTIWYHQPYGFVVEAPGANDRLVDHYARRVGFSTERLPGLHGTATRWQNARDRSSTAFVVELDADGVTERQAARHARAVRSTARLARRAG